MKNEDFSNFSKVAQNETHERQRGQACGSCVDSDNNNFCGNCSSGLQCIKEDNQQLTAICKNNGK